MARIGELIGPNGEVMHPKTSASVVYLEDGRSVEQVLSDDIDYGNVVFQDNSYKFDSDVEDDFAKTVIIKGQTYQNILPEPSTPILTNNKEMFKVNEGLDPNVEIVDGVSKSAILSGSTKYQIGEFIQDIYAPVQQFKTGYYLGPDDGTLIQGGNEHKYCEDYIPLPTGVTSITSKGSSNWKKLCCYDSNKNFISGVNGTAGLEDLTLNIPSNAKYFRYSTNTAQGKNEYINVVSNTGLLLASSNYNIPCKLISCETPVLMTAGKNICDINKYIHGGISTDNGMIFSKDQFRSYYMKCKPSTTYVISVENSNNRFGVASSHTFSEDTPFPLNTSWFTTSSDVTGQTLQYTVTTTKKDKYLYVYVANNGVFNPDIRVQVEEGSVATAYEPHKTNILHTPKEVVLRSLPNGVKDTLNLMTGEYVQRIGETTLDGSSRNDLNYHGVMKEQNGQFFRMIVNQCSFYNKSKYGNCDKLTFYHTEKIDVPVEGVFPYSGDKHFYIQISTSRISGADSMEQSSSELKTAFQDWLQANPITIQYELETPIIKTVDLSSSGNWEKVVLDGSESWSKRGDGDGSTTIGFHTPVNGVTYTLLFAEGIERSQSSTDGIEGYGFDSNQKNFFIELKRSRLTTVDVNGFKQYLQQNPVTLWYQTQTHQDSTQVKEPIFFKDGHIQLSSGADHSLIPTLDYQAKTLNSYVMDLMKTNTKYTMKAKTASDTFTIDGTSYGAGTNGTFTTPPSMTNKLLVISNKTNEEVMILEGDLTSKDIPYFKGIKSAFEDESKIEVLSQGKNLFDISRMNEKAHALPTEVKNIIDLANNTITTTNNNNHTSGYGYIITNLKPNTPYLVTVTNDIVSTGVANFNIGKRDGTSWHEQRIERIPIGATKSRIVYADNGKLNLSVNVMTNGTNGQYSVTLKNIQIEEAISANAKSTTYEPYKSNSTKIPLLSPLRSLPNGVCDELIIDRENNKAKIIQRVGKFVLDGRQTLNGISHKKDGYLIFNYPNGKLKRVSNLVVSVLCDKLRGTHLTDTWEGMFEAISQASNGNYLQFSILKDKLATYDIDGAKKYLAKNPITVYCELETPVITEVDLEGFPYIYKDGHIFLSEGIAPTVGVEYSLNQGQRIAGQVETLQRHEKQFSKLEQYFADLVYSDYNFALLRFSEKLRQQEGDI